jgi:uncharacterized membrane protein YeaQ/YmgE (transglycosylase-associated protein family)
MTSKLPLRRLLRRGERVMGWIAWIIFGLISGFIASKIVNKSGSGILLDMVIGIVGAVVGGEIGERLGLGGLETFWSPWSWLLSIGGAIIILLIYNAIARRA